MQNRITQILNIKYPIVQAPMSWMTDAKLVAAVAEAGGVADVRGVRAAFALGAEGVWVGTAFLATTESRMADNVKELLVKMTANDLHIYRTNPAYYRSVPTALSARLVAMDAQGVSRDEIEKASKAGTGMCLGMLEGDLENGYISVGNGVSLIKEIRPVKALIDDLMQDFKA
ncbi:hypothetical protein BG910_01775 [Neisseria chenwenguii]|uniref:Uncharacterized protein n=1 Tax=Neisseria chenwenguii TaxID=1853278 RepID=A0A220RZS4_9NEIS|nr:nitronate monooxygenase [Neisseria chenwenguii]ASK26638.1 hypothetical protein BG910_01775 [Neisseria chenwenguii]